MRKLILAVLIAAIGLSLSGCQETGEVENQAYILVLAMDRAEEDALELTARIPKIGKSDAKSDKGSSEGSPYLTFSVSGPSWSRALDALQWATPRRINLSHIEMIVVSEALASQPSFPELMIEVAATPHLYTNARFVVCPGSAKAFLEAGETVIGTRMSSEIHAMLSQYASQGFIPDACLADACYCFDGIYEDAIAIWGYTDQATVSVDGSTSKVTESPMRQRFQGTALFEKGRFVKALSPDETRLLNLIRGQRSAVPYAWRNAIIELLPESPALKEVTANGDDVTLSLSLKLRAPDDLSGGNAASLEASIRNDIERLITTCQQFACDPFGFAEAAARHFPTVPQWLAFDWNSRYRRAALDLKVIVSPSQSNP